MNAIKGGTVGKAWKNGDPEASLSPARFSAIARDLFSDTPFVFRLMQRYRPFICPFEVLVPHVPFDVAALDVGCGGGLFLALLAILGRRIRGVGIDSSKPAIQCAQRVSEEINKRSLGSELRFYLLSPDQPLPQGLYDVVSIIDVMHHVPSADQRRFLESAIERVAPGGLLLYKDIAISPLWRRLASRLHDLIIAQQLIHEVPIAVARSWAESAGLVCVDAGPANRLWYGHEFGIFRKPSLPATKA